MVLASVSLYLASPGIDLWPFALVAMLPLAWLVGLERLPGPRAYLKLWLASWLGYVLLLNYLKGAHIGAAIGWPILAAYLAIYPVLFVGATRVAAGLGAMLFNIPTLSLAVSGMFILLMSGMILWQTSEIIHGGETNYIMATVSLYITIFNLLLSLLQILGVVSGDD